MRSYLTLLGVAACAAPPAPRVTPSNRAPATTAARAPGTTGLPGLDWGADVRAVVAAYPAATVRGATVIAHAPHEGKAATITFAMVGPGGTLASIAVAFDDVFASMDGCATTWTSMRAAFDARLGASPSDNLAAYWRSPTTAITLACNPTDDGRAALDLRYDPAPRE